MRGVGKRRHSGFDGGNHPGGFRGLPGVSAAWLDCEGPGGPEREGSGEGSADNGCGVGGLVLLGWRVGSGGGVRWVGDGLGCGEGKVGTGGMA